MRVYGLGFCLEGARLRCGPRWGAGVFWLAACKEGLSNAGRNAFAWPAAAAVGGVWAGCGQRGVSRPFGCPCVVHSLSIRPEGPSIALCTACPCLARLCLSPGRAKRGP